MAMKAWQFRYWQQHPKYATGEWHIYLILEPEEGMSEEEAREQFRKQSGFNQHRLVGDLDVTEIEFVAGAHIHIHRTEEKSGGFALTLTVVRPE